MIYKYTLTIVFTFLLSVPSGSAQDDIQAKKDSLQKVITTLSGKEKLNAYNKLHTIYMDEVVNRTSLDALLAFSGLYEKEAQKQQDIKRQGDIITNKFIACSRCNANEDIQKDAPADIEWLKANQRTESSFVVQKILILSYCETLKYEKALAELKQVYEQAKASNDVEGMFYAHYLTGKVYMYQDRYEEAVNNYRESLEIAGKSKKKSFDLISAYLELCNMLQVMERFDEFDEAINEAETVLRQIEAQDTIRTHEYDWKNLWSVHAYAEITRKDYNKALYYCDLLMQSAKGSMIDLGNITYLQAHIYKEQGKYEEALKQVEQAIEYRPVHLANRYLKIEILSLLENAPLTWAEQEKTTLFVDSVNKAALKTQLDELRTQYEVDKHIAEKEKTRNYLLFALAGCLLLAVALGIWIYLHRQIAKKNRSLYIHIQELLQKEKEVEQQQLAAPEEELSRAGLLFRSLSELMQKEKLFTDPELNRKKLADQLGTNETYLADAIREATGETFSTYLANLRLQYTLKLLNEQPDMTFDAIAIDSGHGSYSAFFRSFSKKYGITPSEYRKMAAVKKIENAADVSV